jgi:predicted DNA binding protein
MRYVTIELRPVEGDSFHPVGERLAADPDLRREAIHTVELLEDGTMAMLAEVSGDLERYAEILEASPEVVEFSVSGADRGLAYSHVEADDLTTSLVEHRGEREFVVDWPVEITDDGAQRVTLVGKEEAFAGADLGPPRGAEVTILETGEYYPEAERVVAALTERQQTVLRAAVDAGYYEAPREATVEDVAARVDCAPGTAAEHLRKVEARVFQRLVG